LRPGQNKRRTGNPIKEDTFKGSIDKIIEKITPRDKRGELDPHGALEIYLIGAEQLKGYVH